MNYSTDDKLFVTLSGFSIIKFQLLKSLCNKNENIDFINSQIELTGFSIGSKLTEHLCVGKNRLVTVKDKMKFICRDLWKACFNKYADRLQTNKKGGFVVLDKKAVWLENTKAFDENSIDENYYSTDKATGFLINGIVSGALNNLLCNVKSTVETKDSSVIINIIFL